MKVSDLEMLSDDVAKVFTDEGNVFFLRLSFLKEDLKEKVVSREELMEDESENLVDAGMAFTAERKAEDLLSRCEQCRFGLTRKLLDRGFEKKHIDVALDYLEGRNFLNDLRFASSWLRMHCSTKFHGRSRLLRELLSRGISKQTAQQALDELFESLDEEELCKKAYEKACTKKTGEKLMKFMMDSGFSYGMIRRIESCVRNT